VGHGAVDLEAHSDTSHSKVAGGMLLQAPEDPMVTGPAEP
jgi:hypothetical protein